MRVIVSLATALVCLSLARIATAFLAALHQRPGTSTHVRLQAYRSLSERRSENLGPSTSSQVTELRLDQISRPLGKTRSNDAAKVQRLMESIAEIGQQAPIDVLLVDGKYYGFSGCHRFEACQRLGQETIRCRVIPASMEVLHMHMR